ncbi:MAG: TIGR00730 family Rossman fold protein [Candidatus Azobacteroides sp.]|nr:TIGR00730 family Rossman fold protein [Candidatus Azobacteroides sp.]
MKTITIYGASSSQIDGQYIKMANELGKLLALNGIDCITGGGREGMMGAVAKGALEAGGQVTGIIPQFMVDEGWSNNALSETIITKSMHERKQLMAQKSDACIALPGGIGTMEELMEIITWRQLSLYEKPVIILNINGYYDPLLLMLEKAVAEKFMHPKSQEIWKVAHSPEEVLTIIISQQELFNMRSVAAM